MSTSQQQQQHETNTFGGGGQHAPTTTNDNQFCSLNTNNNISSSPHHTSRSPNNNTNYNFNNSTINHHNPVNSQQQTNTNNQHQLLLLNNSDQTSGNKQLLTTPSSSSQEAADLLLNQLFEQVNQHIREKRPHEALSLLANQSLHFQIRLEDLTTQQQEQEQLIIKNKTRAATTTPQYQFFNNNPLSFQMLMNSSNNLLQVEEERLRQINATLSTVQSQLIIILLKKVEMLLAMQLEQEAERDLKKILQIDPHNDTANRFAGQLQEQVQQRFELLQKEEEQTKLQETEEVRILNQDNHTAASSSNCTTERKRTNTVYDFKEDCEELECPLCYRVFYEPVTLSCGHTFDRSCICRVHDYSDRCPLCRQTIHVVPYDYPITVVISQLCQKYCKSQYEERRKEMEEQVGSWKQLNVNHLPIFVLDFVLYPHTVLSLHIFEPRYRLMMRRCMSGSKCFGLVFGGNGDGIAMYGCIAKITSFKMLSDGRSIIETIGTDRFKILEKWDTDGGYICAKVQLLMDRIDRGVMVEPPQQDQPQLQPVHSKKKENVVPAADVVSTTGSISNTTTDQSMSHNVISDQNAISTSHSISGNKQTNVWHQAEKLTLQQLNEQLFLMLETFMTEVNDETKQAIIRKIGPFPKGDEPEVLSFWVSAMLPLTTQLKLDLLSMTCTKKRLRVLLSICRQISQSQQTGCPVQ